MTSAEVIKKQKQCGLGNDFAVPRIRTWVVAATTRSTNHYTITARTSTERVRTENVKYSVT